MEQLARRTGFIPFQDNRQRDESRSTLLFVVGAKPWSERCAVRVQLVALEIESDLAGGRLRAIGSVNQVHLATAAVVAADGPRRSLQSAGGAKHLADDTNRLQSLD